MGSGQALPSGTVTFLFTDIEGSTRLTKALGDKYEQVLAEHQGILRAAFAEHNGHEVDTQGDSFFAAFTRARDAINCAVAAQRELMAHEWPDGLEVKVRMGIHTGEPVVGEQRYTGVGVSRAARVGAIGHGGQILTSNATRELIEDDLPQGIVLRDLGRHKLKDIQRPERIYQVAAEGLPWKFPPLKSAGGPVGRARHLGKKGALVVALAAAAAIAAVVVLVTRGGTETAEAAAVAPNSVGIVDPDKGTISTQVPVGSAPNGVDSGEGAVWVTNTGENSVSRIDPTTNTVRQEVPVGGGPTGITVCRGAVWVANGLDGTVTRIDPGTNTPSKPIRVGAGPSAVACGKGAVWVANSSDGTVSRIDPGSWRVTTYPAVVDPSAIAVGFGRVWVASQSTGTVVALDPDTGKVESPISVGTDPDALATGAGSVWVANRSSDTVMRLDPSSRSVTKTTSVGRRPSAIAASARAVWVANSGDGTLHRLDPARGAAVVDTVTLGNPPRGLALDDNGLYVAVRSTGLAHRGGTLRALGNGFVDTLTLDPALSYDWQVTSATHDGLVGFRRVGGAQGLDVVPDLAESVPIPTDDGKTYTFVVRRGMRYSDGRQVEPVDFRHAFERIFRLQSFAGQVFYSSILGAEECIERPESCDLSRGIVTDEGSRTVTFHLTKPDGEFLPKLALPFASAVPADTPYRDLRTRPVAGTGPYRITSVVMKKDVALDEKTHKKTITPYIATVTLRRNAAFREWSPDAQPRGFPDAIVVGAEPDPTKRTGAVQRNTVDIAGDLGFTTENDRLADLAAHHPGRLKSATRPFTAYMIMNTRMPPFDDVRVRRAVNLAVDRDEVARRIGELTRSPTCRVLPPNYRAYRPECPYRGGLEAARRLVTQSGTRGERVEAWVPAGLGPTLGRYIVSLLDSLGYRARLKAIQGDYNSALGRSFRRSQIAFSAWTSDYESPSRFLVDLFSCASIPASPRDLGVNYSKLCDPEVERQLRAALALQTTNPLSATAAWQKAESTILDRAPVAPLYNNRDISFVSSRLGNYQVSPQYGVLLTQAWVK